MTQQLYYDLNNLLSYNSLISVCLSGRGTGKSFACKRQAINNYLKHGKQTVYVRRSSVEIGDVKDTYFADIKFMYPNNELTVEGETGYIDGEPFIYFVSLSTSSNKKSVAYPEVSLMIFDEYIITKTTHTRYLKNEMTLLFDLIETVFRSRDNYKVLIMGNSVSYVNPLFTFFGIAPKGNKRFKTYHNGHICLELFESSAFIEHKNKTRFAQLIHGTEYYNYSVGNTPLEDTDDFIKPKSGGDWRFLCSFYSYGTEIGCWFNNDTHEIYVDNKLDRTHKKRYAVQVTDAKPDLLQLAEYRRTCFALREVKKRFNNSMLFFLNQGIKKFFEQSVIKYL